MENNVLLFVYGTLRSNCPTGVHQYYLHNATLVSHTKTMGQLFLIDYYPGLVIAEQQQDAERWISGEVYLLKSAAELLRLDQYEGCADDSPHPHEYVRKLIQVTLADGRLVTAWTYLYQGDTTALSEITSGDFLIR